MLSRLATTAARNAASPSSRLVQKSLFTTTAAAGSSSHSHLIVNAVGKDRLGIVSEISKHVTDVGGNVGESQATKLGKHFSMMMVIEVPSDQKSILEKELQTLQGMSTAVFETEPPTSTDYTPQIAYSACFHLEGANYPGIVHKVTTFLAQNGLSVDKLETSDEIAPYGGTTLFKMKGIANALEPLAAGFSADQIKNDLALLADELNCDITMQDIDIDGGNNNNDLSFGS